MTDWKAEEDRYVLPTYEKFPLVLERGAGCFVWDDQGNRYLDLYGGHAVCALGHSPSVVTEAIAAQSKRLLFYSNLVYVKARAQAGKALVELCGAAGAQAFFCNSGAEANENAMRVARVVTGRPKIVATVGSFHGRTAGAMAATGNPKYKKQPAGLGADVVHVPFGDLDAAAAALDADAAGFILEPIQSMAGVMTPPAGYLGGLERLCRQHGALLILDQVQTGLGRVGAPTAESAFGVSPDLQTFAKALGSGVPAAAVLAAKSVAARVKSGDLGSTFGGGPLACAAVSATLSEISRLKLWENAVALEALVRETFAFPEIKEIRGRGLLLGLVLDGPSKGVRQALLEKKILVGGADDPSVIRLLPPLTVSAAEILLLRDALAEIFSTQAAAV
ncbi:MAG: aminotransferase class III-fold pyridoxal phosphate-dependent enzyme [Elusimicrobia bacterium]|nr:aminotransferase class III-fold pyridoxal phosphate-dependent enzyme [Elusimicrobiota bacterium]